MNRLSYSLALSAFAFLLLGGMGRCYLYRKPRYEPIDLNSQSVRCIEADDESTESQVERELRKWPAWVNDIVDSDYTDGKDSDVLLSIMPEELKDFCRLAYSKSLNRIIISRGADMEGLDHEMAHFLHDKTGKVGLLFSEHYSGPSWDEIERVMEKRLDFPETSKVAEKLAAYAEIESLSPDITRCAYDLSVVSDRLEKTKSMYRERIDKLMGMGISEDERKFLEDAAREMKADERLEDAAKKSREAMGRMVELEKRLGILGKMTLDEIPLEDMDWLKRKSDIAFGILKEVIGSYKGIIRDLFNQSYIMGEMMDEAEIRKYRKNAEASRKNGNMEDAEAYERLIRFKKTSGRTITDGGELDELFREHIGMRAKMKSGARISKASEVLTAHEQFARVVDSLMSIYVGNYTINHFEITEEELDMLSRMMFRGEPVFGHAIHKYRFAIAMKEEGHDPEGIRKALEFATRFECGGVMFEWPSSGFDIKGTIPELGLPDDLREPAKND